MLSVTHCCIVSAFDLYQENSFKLNLKNDTNLPAINETVDIVITAIVVCRTPHAHIAYIVTPGQ